MIWVLAGLGNLLVGVAILVLRGQVLESWTVAAAGALRIFGTALNIFLSPVFTAGDSGDAAVAHLLLSKDREMLALARRLANEESARTSIDRGWIIGFIATLLAIHIGRMGFDQTFLGIMSPGFATLGDLVIALMLAFVVVIPCGLLSRRLTRRLERRTWRWCLKVPAEERGWARGPSVHCLGHGFASRFAWPRRVLVRTALSRGLQIGLPLAAIIAATVPMWGMSWYFDTENWAAGMWNSWAEERTDTWREAMVRAVSARGRARDRRGFAVQPPGASATSRSSSSATPARGTHRSTCCAISSFGRSTHRTCKFVVISSDVVYPTGAMGDYEAKFWLPFMGVTKPVYAIPGNHDWYDALEGFAATFLRAGRRARRPCARGRGRQRHHEHDRRADRGADRHGLAAAAGVRRADRVPAGAVLPVADRLVRPLRRGHGRRSARGPDAAGLARAALDAARGKAKMAILGHPLYAGGHDTPSATTRTSRARTPCCASTTSRS